jgi:DNA mismatch repair ATPase MutS
MYSDYFNYISSNWLCCIYLDELESVGVSFIDITIGEVKIHSYYTSIDDKIKNIINIMNPKEIILIYNKKVETYSESLYDYYKNKNILICKKEVELSIYHNFNYQNEILKKIYKNTKLLSPIEYCNLEKYPECLKSFIGNVIYSYEHNENIINLLKKPDIILDEDYMYISNNTYDKLNIEYLCKILNNCITNIGKRKFKNYRRLPAHSEQGK